MKVSKEELLHIADLADLNLGDSEIDNYLDNLQDILEKELYFKGGMDSYYYFKKIGVIE